MKWRFKALFISVFFSSVFIPVNAQLDNEVYNHSVCGLNIIEKSVKITDRTTAIDVPGVDMPVRFQITDLPGDCYEILAAYVWWTVSYRFGSPTNPTVSVENPQGGDFAFNVAMTGFTSNKCWNEEGVRGFRADVGAAISGNGNYYLSVNTPQWETDGLTLLIIYRDFKASYQGSLIIRDGLITKTEGSVADTLTGFEACANSTSALAFLIASDLQRSVGDFVPLTLNGTTNDYPRNFWNSEFVPTNVANNQTSAAFGITSITDCYSWIAMGLYYQTKTCLECPEKLILNARASADTICPGSPVALSAGGADKYKWSSLPFGFSSIQRYPVVYPVRSTFYIVRGENENGCLTGADTVRVVVHEAPRVRAGEDKNICEGGSVEIGAVATRGRPPYVYVWSPALGLSAIDGPTPIASPDVSTLYFITVTDANGCMGVDSVMVNIIDGPVANAGEDAAICFGSAISIGGEAGGSTPPYNYQWSPTEGLSDPAAAAPAAGPATSTEYIVTVTDANGCIGKDTVAVIVYEQPEPDAGPDVDICFGESVLIGGPAAGGAPPYLYVWTPADGLSDATAAMPAASPDDSTIYTLTVTDANGCVNYDTASVNVFPLPEPIIIPDGPTRFCTCDSVTLDAGPGYVSYLWSTNETTRTIIVRDEGEYTVEVVDNNGCVNVSPPLYVALIIPATSVAIWPSTLRATPGDTVRFPLFMLSQENLDSCGARNFTALISLNRSLLVPTDAMPKSVLNGNIREIELHGLRNGNDSTLFNLEFVAALGNAEQTHISIESFQWDECPFETDTVGAEFILKGLCYEGGVTRLITGGANGYIVINPNPVGDAAEAFYYVPEEGCVKLTLYNILGERILTVDEGCFPKGWRIKVLDAGELPPGVYYLTLTTRSKTFTKIMEVK